MKFIQGYLLRQPNEYFAKRFEKEVIKLDLPKTKKNSNFPTQWIHDNNKTPEFHINALCKFNFDYVPTGYK